MAKVLWFCVLLELALNHCHFANCNAGFRHFSSTSCSEQKYRYPEGKSIELVCLVRYLSKLKSIRWERGTTQLARCDMPGATTPTWSCTSARIPGWRMSPVVKGDVLSLGLASFPPVLNDVIRVSGEWGRHPGRSLVKGVSLQKRNTNETLSVNGTTMENRTTTRPRHSNPSASYKPGFRWDQNLTTTLFPDTDRSTGHIPGMGSDLNLTTAQLQDRWDNRLPRLGTDPILCEFCPFEVYYDPLTVCEALDLEGGSLTVACAQSGSTQPVTCQLSAEEKKVTSNWTDAVFDSATGIQVCHVTLRISDVAASYSVMMKYSVQPYIYVVPVTFEHAKVFLKRDCWSYTYISQAYVATDGLNCTCCLVQGKPPTAEAEWVVDNRMYSYDVTLGRDNCVTLLARWKNQPKKTKALRCRASESAVLQNVLGFDEDPEDVLFHFKYEVQPTIILEDQCSQRPEEFVDINCTCRLITRGDPPALVRWYDQEGEQVRAKVWSDADSSSLMIMGMPKGSYFCRAVNKFGFTGQSETFPPDTGLRTGNIESGSPQQNTNDDDGGWIVEFTVLGVAGLVFVIGSTLCFAIAYVKKGKSGTRETEGKPEKAPETTSKDTVLETGLSTGAASSLESSMQTDTSQANTPSFYLTPSDTSSTSLPAFTSTLKSRDQAKRYSWFS